MGSTHNIHDRVIGRTRVWWVPLVREQWVVCMCVCGVVRCAYAKRAPQSRAGGVLPRRCLQDGMVGPFTRSTART